MIFSLYCTFLHGHFFNHSLRFVGSRRLQQLCTSFNLQSNLQTLLRCSDGDPPECSKSASFSPLDVRFIHGIKSHLVLAMLSIHMFFNFSVFFTMNVSYFARFPTFYDGVLDGRSLFDLSVQTDVVPIWISAFFIIR